MTRQEHQEVEFHRGPKAFVERRKKPTRTALVSPDIKTRQLGGHSSESRGGEGRGTGGAESRREEFYSLGAAIRLDIVFHEIIAVRNIRPATFFGGGQVEMLAEKIREHEVELVLVDTSLSPIQQRNLERDLGAKVLDRTALILEIFGERAATREGVLQVELAHLNYQRSRLVRSWTHLERQRGGFGFLGGPGETQIEADRRQLRDRIAGLEKRIEKIRKTRQMQRKPRDAVPFALVALVGYTNAGKSSLFNYLSGADVMAKDVLFATLDTTVRKVTLPHGLDIILSDTVGFIADLPTDLIAAFRATLEEVILADIILHVRDVANRDNEQQGRDVLKVVADLGVNPDKTPIIEVWNKIDLLDEEEERQIALKPLGKVKAHICVSAKTGKGMDRLLETIEATLAEKSQVFHVSVPHDMGEDIGWIYGHGEVLAQSNNIDEPGTIFEVRVSPRHRVAFLRRFKGRIGPSVITNSDPGA